MNPPTPIPIQMRMVATFKGGESAEFTIPTEHNLVPVGMVIDARDSESGKEISVIFSDFKVGRESQTANVFNLSSRIFTEKLCKDRFRFAGTGGKKALFIRLFNPSEKPTVITLKIFLERTAVSEKESLTEVSLLGFDYDLCGFKTLAEAVESMLDPSAKKKVSIQPGYSVVIAGISQFSGSITEILMPEDLFDALGDTVDISVSGCMRDLVQGKMVPNEHSRFLWKGEKSLERRSYVLHNADITFGWSVDIEVSNRAFHRAIEVEEFAAVMKTTPFHPNPDDLSGAEWFKGLLAPAKGDA